MADDISEETEPVADLLPRWATSHWPLVVQGALRVVVPLFVLAAAYGVGLALLAEGGTEAILPGLLVGAYIAFAAFGAESSATSAFSTAGDGVEVSLGTRMVPFALWALLLWLFLRALRWVLARIDDDGDPRIAAAKLVLTICLPVGIIGSIVTFDDTTSTSELTSYVSGAAVFFYGTLAMAAVAALHLHRAGRLGLPEQVTRVIEHPNVAAVAGSCRVGVRAFLTLAAASAVATLVAAMIVADDPTERFLLLAGAPIYLVSIGITAAVFFMGGSVSYAGSPGQGHVSLLNFGFPAGPNAGFAPAYWIPVLLAAPLVVAWFTRRHLSEVQPTDRDDAVKHGLLVALGFTLSAWVLAAMAQFSLGGGAHDLIRGFAAIDVEASVAAALGLGALWSLAGALLVTWRWGAEAVDNPAVAELSADSGH